MKDLDRIRNVARRVAKTRAEGNDVVVVVSAMAGETDKLMGMARDLTETPSRREIDLLLSSGERISCALLTIALHAIDCPAVALTGRQMGLRTDNTHTRARIKEIDTARAKKVLQENHVVVVAGFQGINELGDVTTLGRGGSDTSAVALAAALNANLCEIYTDVNGVYTADPRLEPTARKLDYVSFEEMLEMASLGCKVLQIRSVECARNFNMPLVVRSSFNDKPGTLICKEKEDMEQPVVSGVMHDKDQSKVTIAGVPDHPGIAAKIFKALAEAELSVDMIIQNVSAQNHTDISFTLPTSVVNEGLVAVRNVVEKIHTEESKDDSGASKFPAVGAGIVTADSEISKISIVGAGMRSHPGVAAKMFHSLSEEGINIMMISTSEIRISCVIEKKYTELAVQILHKAFGLDKEAESASVKKTTTERKVAGS